MQYCKHWIMQLCRKKLCFCNQVFMLDCNIYCIIRVPWKTPRLVHSIFIRVCPSAPQKKLHIGVGGSVKRQLSKDRNLLVWRWRHVSAVLGHLQVISYLQLTIVKRKHIHRLTWRYCLFVVFNEISLLTRLCFICNWLKLYKYVKSVLN